MKKITFNSNGITANQILVMYHNIATGQNGKMLFSTEEGVDLEKLDYDSIEQKINESISNDQTQPFSFGTKNNARIIGVKVQIWVTANGFDEFNNPIILQAMIQDSEIIYVGGRVLERHEMLSAFNGRLDLLQQYPKDVKGIITVVPDKIFPFIEGKNQNIGRKQKISLLA
jgi:hypothetical protein